MDQKKYAIDILVVSDLESAKKALLGQALAQTVKQWGVIVTSTDGSLHVTPLLCVKNQDGHIQVLELDSVVNPTDFVFHTFRALEEEGKGVLLTVLRILDPRQADSYSCRTDAIVILKDALLDIKQKGVHDLYAILTPHTRDRKQNKFFNLPPSWGKAVQLSKALKDATDQTLVIGRKAQSLDTFQNRYKTSTFKEDVYRIDYRDERGYFLSENLDLKKLITVNRFLNYKGKKI